LSAIVRQNCRILTRSTAHSLRAMADKYLASRPPAEVTPIDLCKMLAQRFAMDELRITATDYGVTSAHLQVGALTPRIWVGEKDGLWFVMERLDRLDENIPPVTDRDDFADDDDYHDAKRAWHNSWSAETDRWRHWVHDRFAMEADAFELLRDLPEERRSSIVRSESSENALISLFKDFRSILKTSGEQWVAYVTSRPIRSTADVLAVVDNKIEMMVGVVTDRDAPMVKHIGIVRSVHYLVHYADKIHRRISIALHSFVARVMTQRYDNKLYLVTNPLKKMRALILRALPLHTYVGHVGYEQTSQVATVGETPIVMLKNRTEILNLSRDRIVFAHEKLRHVVSIFDPKTQTAIEVNGEETISKRFGWFYSGLGWYGTPGSNGTHPFVTVDYAALADNF